MTHSLRYTPASHRSLTKCPLRKIAMRGSCIAGFWTQGFSTIYMGKPVASQFGIMVSRIQDWLIFFRSVIAFTICLSQSCLMKNGRENLKLIFKKGLPKSEISAWKFPTRKIIECFFRRFVCFRNFPLKRRKQPRNWVDGKPAKHPSVPLVCLMGHI